MEPEAEYEARWSPDDLYAYDTEFCFDGLRRMASALIRDAGRLACMNVILQPTNRTIVVLHDGKVVDRIDLGQYGGEALYMNASLCLIRTTVRRAVYEETLDCALRDRKVQLQSQLSLKTATLRKHILETEVAIFACYHLIDHSKQAEAYFTHNLQQLVLNKARELEEKGEMVPFHDLCWWESRWQRNARFGYYTRASRIARRIDPTVAQLTWEEADVEIDDCDRYASAMYDEPLARRTMQSFLFRDQAAREIEAGWARLWKKLSLELKTLRWELRAAPHDVRRSEIAGGSDTDEDALAGYSNPGFSRFVDRDSDEQPLSPTVLREVRAIFQIRTIVSAVDGSIHVLFSPPRSRVPAWVCPFMILQVMEEVVRARQLEQEGEERRILAQDPMAESESEEEVEAEMEAEAEHEHEYEHEHQEAEAEAEIEVEAEVEAEQPPAVTTLEASPTSEADTSLQAQVQAMEQRMAAMRRAARDRAAARREPELQQQK